MYRILINFFTDEEREIFVDYATRDYESFCCDPTDPTCFIVSGNDLIEVLNWARELNVMLCGVERIREFPFLTRKLHEISCGIYDKAREMLSGIHDLRCLTEKEKVLVKLLDQYTDAFEQLNSDLLERK